MSLVNAPAEPRLELDSQGNLECAICLLTCVHPAKLPCGHVFCFLCLKGVTLQSRRCAMCRQDIPSDYLDKPELLEVENTAVEEIKQDDYQWYYEGRNGWWRYDVRSNLDIETAWQKGNSNVELLLAGALYTIDFDNMVQQRARHPSRKRKIKRDSVHVPAKGTAGLKCEIPGQSSSTAPLVEESSTSENENAAIATLIDQIHSKTL